MWHKFADAMPNEGEFHMGFLRENNMADHEPGLGCYVQLGKPCINLWCDVEF